MKNKFNQAFQYNHIRGQATGMGSLVNLHFTDHPIHNARDSIKGIIGAGPLLRHFHLCMLQHGIFPASRQMYCISAPMEEAEIDKAAEAMNASLGELKPIIKKDYPHLLL